jgi:hypothetical protein
MPHRPASEIVPGAIALLVIGIVFVAAAIVGGGVEVAEVSIPVLGSVVSRALLGVLGLAVMGLSVFISQTPEPPPRRDTANGPARGPARSSRHGGDLRLGARTPGVRIWQQLLNATQSAGIDEDGRFGPATRAATVAFQKDHGLEPDGRVGHETLKKMAATWR